MYYKDGSFSNIISFTAFREANQLSEEMGKETEFAVTLQVYSVDLRNLVLLYSLRRFK